MLESLYLAMYICMLCSFSTLHQYQYLQVSSPRVKLFFSMCWQRGQGSRTTPGEQGFPERHERTSDGT